MIQSFNDLKVIKRRVLKIAIYYYSGAGNTKFIVNKINRQLKELQHETNLVKITNNSILNVKNYDTYIVGFPIYDLTSPQLVKDLLANIKDRNRPISFFCTKAFASGESIKELSELSNKHNLQTIATMELYMHEILMKKSIFLYLKY